MTTRIAGIWAPTLPSFAAAIFVSPQSRLTCTASDYGGSCDFYVALSAHNQSHGRHYARLITDNNKGRVVASGQDGSSGSSVRACIIYLYYIKPR